MSEITAVTVTVPATTANLGPGFDCLGAALTLYNQFTFRLLSQAEIAANPNLLIQIAGAATAAQITPDRSNLVYQAFCHYYHHVGQIPPAIAIQIQVGYPLARGLGSSATAIVGGLMAANALAGSPLAVNQLLQLAIALEGHPDNVAPALLGGCCLAAVGQDASTWTICDVPWAESIVPIVAIPDFELATAKARRVLPGSCSYADAIFNTAHLGLLLRGLATGRRDWLQAALQDRLHQPYRQHLIPGYEAVQTAALEAGAHGLVISGAGPSLLALAEPACAAHVAASLGHAWETTGVQAKVEQLQLDFQGAIAHPVLL